MEEELEYDMQGPTLLAGAPAGALKAGHLAEAPNPIAPKAGDSVEFVGDEHEEAALPDDEDDAARRDEEEYFEEDFEVEDEEDEEEAEDDEEPTEAEDQEEGQNSHPEKIRIAAGGDSIASELKGKKNKKKKKRAGTRSKSSPPGASRLSELSKPRQAAEVPELPKPPPRPEKQQRKAQPSLLFRLKPTNLAEAWTDFEASGYSVAPRFTYAFDEEVVAQAFQKNSDVCFELLPEAERIIDKVQTDYGGAQPFMQKLFGQEKITAERMRDIVTVYLQDHGIDDKVEVRIVDSVLAAAYVAKPGPDEKYTVNIASGGVSETQIQGICDHEVGTHLLRMMNDEHQAWHGRRDRYKLVNPWTTEEGFATLNTYQTMPCKLMYPQALRYFAVCQGARVGFVELFQELRKHVDEKKCWQMCCRIKRGMTDTSLPGAFYMDQAYFKGAVEILRHLDEVDFGRLYGGQIALQDMDKVHFLLRKDCVKLPHFLNTPDKLNKYMSHCRKLIKENGIQAACERVCKQIYVRNNAKEILRQKSKAELRASSTSISFGAVCRTDSNKPTRLLDTQRLESLACPRSPRQTQERQLSPAKLRLPLPPLPPVAGEVRLRLQVLQTKRLQQRQLEHAHNEQGEVEDLSNERVANLRLELDAAETSKQAQLQHRELTELKAAEPPSKPRLLDLARVEALAQPRAPRVQVEDEAKEIFSRTVDLSRLADLAKPRNTMTQATDAAGVQPEEMVSRAVDLSRLADLARPRNTMTQATEVAATALCGEQRQRKVNKQRLLDLALPKLSQESSSLSASQNTAEKSKRGGSAPAPKKGSCRSKQSRKGGTETECDDANSSAEEGGGAASSIKRSRSQDFGKTPLSLDSGGFQSTESTDKNLTRVRSLPAIGFRAAAGVASPIVPQKPQQACRSRSRPPRVPASNNAPPARVSGGIDSEGSMWKAVPINMVQFDLGV